MGDQGIQRPAGPECLTAAELTALVETAGKAGVVRLRLGTLEVDFGRPPNLEPQPGPQFIDTNPVATTGPAAPPATAEDLKRSTEDVLDELAILDPAMHEEIVRIRLSKD